MQLDSALGLKQELLTKLVNPLAEAASPVAVSAASSAHAVAVARSLDVAMTLPVGAKAVGQVQAIQRSVALGVARGGSGYQLAIRVQRQALLNSPIVDRLVQEAKGEADVRLIGRIDKRGGRHGRALPDVSGAPPLKMPQGRLRVPPVASAAAAPWFQRNTRPLLIGASVGHVDVTAGTIGAFVRRGHRICLLSNNHVLANENAAIKGDIIVQRGTIDGGSPAADRVGAFLATIALKTKGTNLVDAALAVVDAGVAHDPTRLRELVNGADRVLAGLGPDFLDEGAVVRKVGRTTGPTVGRVTAFDLDNVVVNYDVGNLRFDGQIEIEGSGKAAFSDGGDSGSLIVDDDLQAVALLFAGGDVGGTNGLGLTYANPIHRVLEALNSTLIA